jgi:hypothetical protein
MGKLYGVVKNLLLNKSRGEKIKGQLNENFSFGQLYMCKSVVDNQTRKYFDWILNEMGINHMWKLYGVVKNLLLNMSREEKIKGQLNENFSFGQLYMCKRVVDNQTRKYEGAMGQNLKGGYNENLDSGNCRVRTVLTWTRVILAFKNGAQQFQIKGKRPRFDKVPVVGILFVCGEYLSQDPKKGENLKCVIAGSIKHDD